MIQPLITPAGLSRARHLVSVPGPPATPLDWVPLGRELHLSDVENLMGGPFAGPEALVTVRDQYAALALPGPTDHVISACNPRLVHVAAGIWFPGRWVTRRGTNGADMALLDAADPDDLARRYCRVVIGSGDGAFAPLARALKARGVEVRVIARAGSLAPALGRSADDVHLLHPTTPALHAAPESLDAEGTEPEAA